MHSRKIIFTIVLFIYGLSFSQVDSKTSILFIGNSLTYTNELPSLVKKESERKGITVKTKMVAYPNYGLEDHWSDGKVQKLIKKNAYDFIIIQQGPSSQEYGRISLIDYGEKLKKVCETTNTKLVYFMVWPSKQYYHTFEGVIKNHTDAAKRNNALLAPVGKAWKVHFDKTNDFSYYGADGFHPSLKGSEIAAKVIVKTLFSN